MYYSNVVRITATSLEHTGADREEQRTWDPVRIRRGGIRTGTCDWRKRGTRQLR